MRIHTKLDVLEIQAAARNAGAPISFHTLSEHGSRTHAHSFEVRLEGSGGRNNTGLYGAGDYEGATWDEWGAFFGALYDLDPTARCGGSAKRPTYANREHYHYVTGYRFGRNADGRYLPTDTHPRHRWIYQGALGSSGLECSKCGATTPGNVAAESYRERVTA